MIQALTELTEDLKGRGINPVFHFMDNEASTVLKMTMSSMIIKYQLMPPSNNRANNVERTIQTFKNRLIAGLFRVYKDFHLQLWYILSQQAKISLNLIRQSIILPHLSAYTHIIG